MGELLPHGPNNEGDGLILGIVQARVSSSRLPRKVLADLLGRPMIAWQIERLKRSKRLDQLVVATSTSPEDDELARLAAELGIACFRGSLTDVLDRFYQACTPFKPEHVVRLTGDCPLSDPQVIDQVIAAHLAADADYTSNVLEPTYPDGLDVEVMKFSTLKAAWREAQAKTAREHVTFYIYNHPERFRLHSVKQPVNQSHLRWTVDEPADFALITRIYEALVPNHPEFNSEDVLELLAREPQLATLNTGITRNEGLERSLVNEQAQTPMRQRITKSLALQQHAKTRIPGLSQLLSKRPDQFSFGVWPGYFKTAKGVEVEDLDGNRYIDMSIGGIGANVLGYADPDVNQAVTAAIAAGSSCSLNCPEEVALADLLCELHPWAGKVRFTRGGGEAMSVAVRIARAHTGRDRIVFSGYHGWNDWYLAANLGTENALGEHLLPDLSPSGVPKSLAGTALPFRYNHLDELEAIMSRHGEEVAAVVIEPIRSEEPVPGFLEGVASLARRHGCLLIVDEISAGFRLLTGGAHLRLGLTPDIAVFSKALGNGFPIAAIIGNDAMEAAQSTFISSTNWTERVGYVAAIATLEKHRRLEVAAHLVAMGSAVQAGWKDLSHRYELDLHVGGIAPLSHFAFSGSDATVKKALFVQLMLKEGFLASTSFYSMYAHQFGHVEAYLAAADQAMAQVAERSRAGSLQAALEGAPATAGFRRLT